MHRTVSRTLWLAGLGLGALCLSLLVTSPFELAAQGPPANPGDVVINEVAWGGTPAGSADEWIELYNPTTEPIALDGWSLAGLDGTPAISLTGVIPAGGYLLLERSDDNTVSDVPADLIYTGALDDGGETLRLLDAGGSLIDTANAAGGPWPAGSAGPDHISMERVDPLATDSAANWAGNNGSVRNGSDADGNPLNATPGQPNSSISPVPTPTATPTSTPTSTPTATSTSMPIPTLAPSRGAVVINEVAWGGTAANAADEWVELFNTTTESIALDGWSLTSLDGAPAISLGGVIPPGGYFLLERTDDSTVSDVPADLIYSGGLDNTGESLQLLDPGGTLIDTANAAGGPWPAGSGGPDYTSMERVNALSPDTVTNWTSNNGVIRNGLDANGSPLNATPRQPNSSIYPVPTPTATATPTSTATPTPTATSTPTPIPTRPPSSGDVVIHEVAWGGTAANAADEWIELYNTTGQAIPLTGWTLASLDGSPLINLGGAIPPGGYYLLERTDDSTVSDIPADLTYTGGLGNGGETLQLSDGRGALIDTANAAGGPWPAGSGSPGYYSMERIAALLPDAPANWAGNNGVTRNGRDAGGNPLNGTPKQPNSIPIVLPTPIPSPTPAPASPPKLLIGEFLYDALTPGTSGDEFVELCNADAAPVDLTGFKVGDEETPDRGEGMYRLPDGWLLAPDQCLVIAKNAAPFAARFGFYPDGELVVTGPGYEDTPQVPNLRRYTAWGNGDWALADTGDEVLLLDPADRLVDSVACGDGDYAAVGVAPDASAPEPDSLQRIWPLDSDSMPADFVRKTPNPGSLTYLPIPPASPSPAADLPLGMHAYWGILHSHSSYSDGAGPPSFAFATARANGLHFLALTDHDGGLSPEEWADLGAQAAAASLAGEFVALRGYEYTHATDGHLAVWNTEGLASYADPLYDTLGEFYAWLAAQPAALAGFNHPFEVDTFHEFAYAPSVAPQVAMLEVGNGSELSAQYQTFEEQWMRALASGWRAAPANNGDTQNAVWGADTAHRTGLVAPALADADLLEAMRARRAFATEDSNLALTLRNGDTWMGSAISNATILTLTVNAVDLDPVSEPITLTLYDRALPLASAAFSAMPAEWTVVTPARPGHFYWARALQADGDLAQTAPLWVEGTPSPEAVVVNEVMPAPSAVDWDGDGTLDHRDEWLELYNMGDSPVGLGGWPVGDASGSTHLISLGASLPPGGYAVFYQQQTGLTLNNDADTLILRRPDGTLADSYVYDKGPGYDISLCRAPDGKGSWRDRCDPTPGGPNRALPEPSPVEASVFEARHMGPGGWVKLRGRVTVPAGVLGARTAYLQDETGGIRLSLPREHRLWADLGERWEVVGHIGTYYGELEVRVSQRGDVRTLKMSDPRPPLPINTGMMVEPYEGMLVLLSGQAVQFERGGHFWLDDGTGWARIYLDPDARIRRPRLEVGQLVQVVGVVSQYTREHPPEGGYRLLPRYPFDLVVLEPPPAPHAGWPALLPETGRQ